MPRCCVPGCDTGTSAEIVRMRKAKARNKSTFLLPADYRLFKKWEKVLGLKYDTIDGRSGRVCELHFDEADIIRYYYKQMENGTIQQFTFSRPTLKKGIIPLSTPRKEDLLPQNHKYKKNKKKSSKAQNNKNDVSIQSRGTKRKNSSENDDVPIKRHTKSSNADKAGKASKNYKKRKYKRQIKTCRNKLISKSVKKRDSLIYNFDKLKHNLHRKNCKVPTGWEFSILDDNTVQFVYKVESSNNFLTCTLKRETFLEIRAFNINVAINLEFKFLSQAHLLESLIELQKVRCCKGITYKRFTKQCMGFIPFREKYQRLKNFDRCSMCQKVWKNITRRHSHHHIQKVKFLHLRTSKLKFNANINKYSKKKKNLKKIIKSSKKSETKYLKKSIDK
ncbi:uncharacterized protein LOC131666492 isoform X2 [Phymastichus coffea]|uniref:uncharacterized protein LOC131666492 isoform X2 n=1 Tax=Phymastichus coffea TaxID=108790 RepID=UPI00273B4E9E|nr:uncharacterized protein LOC131666492 isoform X2 [Phymastichus coffea]